MDESIADLAIADSRERMAKAVAHTQADLSTVRTGRASPSLVEKLKVDYYGEETPLQSLASFNVPEARLLVITPFDKGSVSAIEKAIQQSDLGITPNNDGQVIRLAFPALNEERRKELVKVVRHKAEEGRVAVRNVRRSSRHELEGLQKDGELSGDDVERAEKELERVTHEHVAEIDRILAAKERELLDI